jgi:predicted ATPase
MDIFRRIQLRRWRQFESVDIDLDSKATVLTGPNGCGKTTILNVLGRHFGWNLSFLTGSTISPKDKKLVVTDTWPDPASEMVTETIGDIQYGSGAQAQIHAPSTQEKQYQLQIHNQQPVEGLHIPSHRPPPGHHRIKQIPIDPKTTQQHYQSFQSYLYATYGEGGSKSPLSAMKEALVSFAVFGEGNSSVRRNDEYVEVLKGFEKILSLLLPSNIGFIALEVRTPDVFLRTRSGDFPLESMSGGLNALFGMAWQIHVYGFNKGECTVLVDEPENHLHPSMQREFLPKLSEAFPNYRFVVASHSPFIVSSHPDAAVYALNYNAHNRVVTSRLRAADLAASPNNVLREILDVEVTMPRWAEKRISDILKKFEGKSMDSEMIVALRLELEEQGVGKALGDFLIQAKGEDERKT